MVISDNYYLNNILILICFLIVYVQSIHLSRFNIYRRRTIPFILYSSSFVITAASIISMAIFLKDNDIFNYSIALYIIGLLIKSLGKLIYAKQQNDRKVYKETLFPFKVMARFVVVSVLFLTAVSIIVFTIYKVFY